MNIESSEELKAGQEGSPEDGPVKGESELNKQVRRN